MTSLSWLLTVALAGAAAQTINFDSGKPGTVPPGWTAVPTQPGPPPKWEIVKDPSAPSPPYVFAQVSRDKMDSRCPIAILNKFDLKDGDVSVNLKPVAGKEDRAGGLIWRYRDANNYYLVRANALRNNIAIYKVENGKATPLAAKGRPETHGIDHSVPANQWSVLKVQFRGPLFSVYFNHRRLFQVVDSTFAQSGKVGLWTKADSVTYFDDFRVAGK